MEKYGKLKAYRVAYQLCLATYKLTSNFPPSEKFALVQQLRRAAYSVIANIAEGSRMTSDKERVRYHTTAIGSLEELKCLYSLATDLGYMEPKKKERVTREASDTGKMLVGLNKSLAVG